MSLRARAFPFLASLALSASLVAGRLDAQEFPSEPPLITPVLSSLAGAAIGFFGGAVVGKGLSEGCAEYFCDLGAVVLGAVIGETFGAAIGAHVGNRRRGNFGLDLLASAAVATGGLALASTGGDDSGSLLLVGLGAQVAVVVAVERSTGRAKEQAAAVTIAPVRSGGVAVGMRIPLP